MRLLDTPIWIWSLFFSVASLSAQYLVGKYKAVGWLIGFLIQPISMFYDASTAQYGFLLSGVVFLAINYSNWRKWSSK